MRRFALLLALVSAASCRRTPDAVRPDEVKVRDAQPKVPETESKRALLHGRVVDLSTGEVVSPHDLATLPRDEWSQGNDGFLLEADDTLRARDLSTGAERWSVPASCRMLAVGRAKVACNEAAALVVADRATGKVVRVPTGKAGAIDEVRAVLDHFVVLQGFDLRVVDGTGAVRATTHLLPAPLGTLSNRRLAIAPDGFCYVTFDAPDFTVRCFDLDAKPLRTTRLVLSKPGDPPYTRVSPLLLGPHHVLVGTFSFGGFPAARRAAVVRLADGGLVTMVEDEVVALAEKGDGTLEGLLVASPELRFLDVKGTVRWTRKPSWSEPMAAAVLEGDRVVVARFNPIATGVDLVALRVADGTEVWKGETKLPPIGHSKYRNDVSLEARAGSVILRGDESAVRHVHLYDATTGALRFSDAPPR